MLLGIKAAQLFCRICSEEEQMKKWILLITLLNVFVGIKSYAADDQEFKVQQEVVSSIEFWEYSAK